MAKKKKHSSIDILLSILSGVLLGLSWPTYGFTPIIFIALIPLLFLEQDLLKYHKCYAWNLIRYTFIAFLIFCGITTWWICKVSFSAGITAVVLNAIVMTFFFQIYHLVRSSLFGKQKGQWILIPIWLTFEFMHYNWDLNFPWLNFGNVFAESIKFIQWYEVTGVFGGSLWILVVNVLLFHAINYAFKHKDIKKVAIKLIAPVAILIIPSIYSIIRYNTYKETDNPIDVVVYQPNSDPFGEQFTLMGNEVVDRLFLNSDGILDGNTDFIVCPESALQDNVFEHQLYDVPYIHRIRKGLQTKAPNAAVIIGATTFKLYYEGDRLSRTARKYGDNMYYDVYNTTLYVDTTDWIQLHHKSRLTPGVEIMPYIGRIKVLERLALNLGGAVGSLGVDSITYPFTTYGNAKIASLICYESIFGGFACKIINKGANVIFVSTNDGWWGDTQGYRQHCAYASLLAISTRRDIARSANTGRSCTINQRGDISNATPYWKPAVFKETLNLNDKLTFYVRYGDFIAYFSLIVFIVLIISSIIFTITVKRTYW